MSEKKELAEKRKLAKCSFEIWDVFDKHELTQVQILKLLSNMLNRLLN